MEIAKIFMNGRSQAVRLPKKFRFEGSQVYIKKVGDAVILIPYQEPWQTLQDSLSMFSDDFMETRDQTTPQEREDLFT
jgi:antitoxin VapB